MRTELAFLLLVATPALARPQRPDPSGTWAVASGEAPANLPLAPSAILGAQFALRLEGESLVITRTVRDASLASTFPLAGTTVATRIPGRLCEGEQQFHEQVTWDGKAYVFTVVGVTPAGGGDMRPSNTARRIHVEAPDRLVVEATIVQGGQRRQVGSVYRKTTSALPPLRAAAAGAAKATIADVAWIGTTWMGTTGTVTTEERWTPPASGAMMAVARTLRNGALASFEFLCIAERDGSLAYIAMPDGRTTPTVFMLTSISPTGATFENPSHDFPRLVRYTQKDDGTLETTIAGEAGARAQSVTLKRQ
jgi:hypothetical protein